MTAIPTQSWTLSLTKNCGKVARYDATLPDGSKVNFYAPHGTVIDPSDPPKSITLSVKAK